MKGYNFTDSVRTALATAREEAVALGHEYIGTEHILLALSATRDQRLLSVWRALDVHPAQLRKDVRDVVPEGRGKATGPDLPYTTRAKRILELSMKEAFAFGDTAVDPTHLLLAAAREGQGVAAHVLAGRKVTHESARTALAGVRGCAVPATSEHAGRVTSVDIVVHLQDGRSLERRFEALDKALAYLAAYGD